MQPLINEGKKGRKRKNKRREEAFYLAGGTSR